MAPLGEGYQSIDSGQNLRDDRVGSIEIIRRDESPNLVFGTREKLPYFARQK
jgi:hypothetical protein